MKIIKIKNDIIKHIIDDVIVGEETMEHNTRELSVFIDESGTTKINKELYVCVALIVPTEEVESFLLQISDIAQKYTNGIIKSSKIRSAATRTQLLSEICKLRFSYIALIVNKSELEQYPGLQYPESFYKFLHKRFAVCIDLVTKCNKIHFEIDSYGSPTFEEQFEKYFHDRMSLLFPEVTLKITNDENSYGIQVADLIAGTLGRCYFYNRDSENADAWLKILDSKCAGHKLFPPQFKDSKELSLVLTEEDQRIANCLLENSYKFLSQNMTSDDNFVLRQCMTLRLLIAKANCADNSYIYSDEIMKYLEDYGFEKIRKQVFTSQVIGKLREARIIISGNVNGYRLALTKEDIESYIKHNDAIISPMIYRLSLATGLLQGAFQTDVLKDYDNLREFVRVYRHNVTLIGTEIDEERGIFLGNTNPNFASEITNDISEK